MHFHNPKHAFLILAALAVTGIFSGIVYWTRLGLFWAYLISVGIVTFAAYGLDKQQARRGRGRIPEAVLHLLALAGGTPGAAIGQFIFRHKRRKWQFQIVFLLIFLAQFGVVILYCLYGRA